MFKTVKCAMAFSLHLCASNVEAVILKTMLQSSCTCQVAMKVLNSLSSSPRKYSSPVKHPFAAAMVGVAVDNHSIVLVFCKVYMGLQNSLIHCESRCARELALYAAWRSRSGVLHIGKDTVNMS